MSVSQKIDIRQLLVGLRKLVSIKLGLFVVLVVLTTLAFKQGIRTETSFSVGDRWQKETLVAESEFPLYKSTDSLQAERQRVRDSIEPIFYTYPDARQQTRMAVDTISALLDTAFDAYTDYLVGARRDTIAAGSDPALVSLSESTIEDSLRFMELRLQVPIRLSDSVWRLLGWDYALRSPDIPTATRLAPTSPPLFERILNEIASRSQRLQLQGALDVPIDSIRVPYLTVRDTLEQTFDRRPTTEVVGQNAARERIQVWLEETVLQEDSPLTSTAMAPIY